VIYISKIQQTPIDKWREKISIREAKTDNRAAEFTAPSTARNFKRLYALVEKYPSDMCKIAIYLNFFQINGYSLCVPERCAFYISGLLNIVNGSIKRDSFCTVSFIQLKHSVS